MRLRTRIQVLLAFLVAMPLLILFFEVVRSGHRTVMDQMQVESLQIAALQAAEMDLTFVPARETADGLARSMETAASLDPEAIKALLRHSLDHAPEIYGLGVALSPEATSVGRFAPYVFRADGRFQERSLHDPAYEYTRWDWYRLPMALGQGHWTQPYFDRGGGDTLMITYSAPIRRYGHLIGVAAADLSLDGLVKRLGALRPGGNGSVSLVGKDGRILLHPALLATPSAAPEEDPQAVAVLKSLMRHPGTDMRAMNDPVSRRKAWVVEMPVRSMAEELGGPGWSVVVSWPMGQRMGPYIKLGERVLCLFLFLGGGALMFLNRAFEEMITRPIRRLARQARRYAHGDFAGKAGLKEEALELEELSQALGQLGTALAESEQKRAEAGGRKP
jgi:sigma-B regulation protein RsbU (phosphoserine phosphatase)